MVKLSSYAKFSWGVLAYTLLVILWGAFVRATHSGAGCGSHWPLCNGEVVPQSPQIETLIEFTHRLSSGLALPLTLVLVVWAFRAFPRGDAVRGAALASFILMVTEALIGAGVVIFEMVAHNASIARGYWMVSHLLNTFLLLAALSLTAWWASGGPTPRLRGQGSQLLLVGVGLLGLLLLGASGAIAALGDTLFPARSLAEGLQQDLSPSAHIFLRLRLLHPAIAIGASLYLLALAQLAQWQSSDPLTRRLARSLIALLLLQLGVGVVNVALLAPVWLQLLHLLVADLLWITLLLLSNSVLALPPSPVRAAHPDRRYSPPSPP